MADPNTTFAPVPVSRPDPLAGLPPLPPLDPPKPAAVLPPAPLPEEPAPAPPPKPAADTAWVREALGLLVTPSRRKAAAAAGLLSLGVGAAAVKFFDPLQRPTDSPRAELARATEYDWDADDWADLDPPPLPKRPNGMVTPPADKADPLAINLDPLAPIPAPAVPGHPPKPDLPDPLAPAPAAAPLPALNLPDPNIKPAAGETPAPPVPDPKPAADPPKPIELPKLDLAPPAPTPTPAAADKPLDLPKLDVPSAPPTPEPAKPQPFQVELPKLEPVKLDPPKPAPPPAKVPEPPALQLDPPKPAPPPEPVKLDPVKLDLPTTPPTPTPGPPALPAIELKPVEPKPTAPPSPAIDINMLAPPKPAEARPPAPLPTVLPKSTDAFPVKPAPATDIRPAAATTFDVDLHYPKPGDSYAGISRELLGDDRYAAALEAHNKYARLDDLRASQQPVEVPPVAVLRRKIGRPTAEPVSRTPEPRRPAGKRVYVVPAGGRTMKQVAAAAFGDENFWGRVYDDNRGLLPDQPIPPGTQVVLPADARIGE